MKQISQVEDKVSRRLHISVHKPAEPVFVNPLSSPGIDSQPGFLGSLNVYKYGLCTTERGALQRTNLENSKQLFPEKATVPISTLMCL
jgi:hypothetical protein